MGKRLVVITMAIVLIAGSGFVVAKNRNAINRYRLSRVADEYLVCLYHADAYFTKASTADSAEYLDNIRLAGAWVLAARYTSISLSDEASRQGILVSGINYFLGVNAEEIVIYSGPGLNPELDHRLDIIAKNVRILQESLDRDLFASGDKRKIQETLMGITLLPPR